MKILIAGDFVPRHRVAELFAEKKYAEVLGEIKPIVDQSDFSIVNLEAPVIYGEPTPITKTGPNLSCSENAVEALKWAGFDCVTLANNHFYDQGEQGVEGTLKACEKYAMSYVGAGRNLQEAETVLYKEIEGKTLAIVNCCEHEWSIASDEHGGSNPLNPIKQYYAIQEAKTKADYVLVIVHGGTEHYQLPTPRMKETYRFFIDLGADAVINHHQHCYSGYEVYHGKPVFYGLGNFCFEKTSRDDSLWNEGYMVSLSFYDESPNFELLPYTQCGATPCVTIITEQLSFLNRIKQLNDIIADDALLVEEFKQMAQRKKSLLSFLEPYRNKYMKLLFAKGLLPSFLSQEKKNLILEIFRCEAHFDVMQELLFDDSIYNIK